MNPNKFEIMTEYIVLLYAVGLLFLSECVIMVLTLRKNRNSTKKSDRGTIWLIVFGWYISLMTGIFFRSHKVPEFMHNWLLPHFIYFLGIAFIVLGVLIRCIAVLTLKKAFTLSVQTARDQHLIKTGLYHVVRNPAYTGSIISLLGVAFAYRHIIGIAIVLLICFICYGTRISIEEKALKAQFKEEFEQYCIQTKYRIIPGIY